MYNKNLNQKKSITTLRFDNIFKAYKKGSITKQECLDLLESSSFNTTDTKIPDINIKDIFNTLEKKSTNTL